MRARRINRTTALRAVRAAADAAGVDPEQLEQRAYRRMRAEDPFAGLPSDLAITLLFGRWQHACELAHEVSRQPQEVEDDVREALYGGGRSQVDRVAGGVDAAGQRRGRASARVAFSDRRAGAPRRR